MTTTPPTTTHDPMPDPIAPPDSATPAPPAHDDAPPPRPRTYNTAIGVGIGAAAASAVLIAARLLRRRGDNDRKPANTRGPAFALGSLGAEQAVALVDHALDQLGHARGNLAGRNVRNSDGRGDHDDAHVSDGSAAHPYRGAALVDTRAGHSAQLAWRLWWTGRAWRVAFELHGCDERAETEEAALIQFYERLSARLSRASALAVRNQLAREAATRPKPPPPTIDV